MKRIIAIDPGFNTGYAILEIKNNSIINLLTAGEISTTTKDKKRLWPITKGLVDIINSYKPEFGIIESTFVNKNPLSSLKLGMSRGASIIAFEQCDIGYTEISPTSVRKIFLKKGNSSKQETKKIIENIFKHQFGHNSSDAIAIGISFLKKSHKEYNFTTTIS